MPNKEFLEAIASSDFLNGCSFDSSSVIRKTYNAGAYLSDNNNGKGFIGLIASGILDIYSVALDGRDTMLNSLHKGNCFGICNLFDCTQMETVIRSRTNAVVYFIPKNIIVTAMEQDASLAMKYALVCNKKIQFLIKRIELISTQSCRSKLAEYLISNQDAENCIIPNCSMLFNCLSAGKSFMQSWRMPAVSAFCGSAPYFFASRTASLETFTE